MGFDASDFELRSPDPDPSIAPAMFEMPDITDAAVAAAPETARALQPKDASETASGILSTAVESHCTDETYYINMGCSYLPGSDPNVRYIKMKGRKVYEYALKHVPAAMKACIDKSGVDIRDIRKIFIHQANEKMDEAIIRALYKLYGIASMPDNIMPMNIRELGNSSVATIPTLLDMVHKGHIPNHEVHTGDVVVFASVGAGMNINAVCYRV